MRARGRYWGPRAHTRAINRKHDGLSRYAPRAHPPGVHGGGRPGALCHLQSLRGADDHDVRGRGSARCRDCAAHCRGDLPPPSMARVRRGRCCGGLRACDAVEIEVRIPAFGGDHDLPASGCDGQGHRNRALPILARQIAAPWYSLRRRRYRAAESGECGAAREARLCQGRTLSRDRAEVWPLGRRRLLGAQIPGAPCCARLRIACGAGEQPPPGGVRTRGDRPAGVWTCVLAPDAPRCSCADCRQPPAPAAAPV